MKAYILDLGWMEGDENWMAALSTYATKENRDVKCRWSRFPVYGVLFDTPEGKILFDTGMNPADYDVSNRFPYYYRENQLMENQLKSVGLQTSDINIVILSHLHDDHCGNLGLFPKAKVYVAKDEYEYVKNERENARVPKGAYKRALLEGVDFQMVVEDFWITKELQVINLPGHSHGLLGVVAHLNKSGVKIFAMDASNSALNYGPPTVTAVGLFDNEQYFRSIEKVRKLEDKYHGEVIFGHDMNQFMSMKHAPSYYE